MNEKLEVEIERLKEFVNKKPLLNKLFESEIKRMTKKSIMKKGWMIFITGLVFGLMLGYVVGLLMV